MNGRKKAMEFDQSMFTGYTEHLHLPEDTRLRFKYLIDRWPATNMSVWKASPYEDMVVYGLVKDKIVVGFISLSVYDHEGVAIVDLSELHPDYRGQGLGRKLYKTVVNDLLKTYECVQSDTLRSRAAQGVWKSICRTNPKKVIYHRSQPYEYDSHFEVRGPGSIRRRPVRVRTHQRQWK